MKFMRDSYKEHRLKNPCIDQIPVWSFEEVSWQISWPIIVQPQKAPPSYDFGMIQRLGKNTTQILLQVFVQNYAQTCILTRFLRS